MMVDVKYGMIGHVKGSTMGSITRVMIGK